ncbi:MAG TPA: FtsQ-type POTRA domain-containing protein, partial [Feifaniaceae bacterium]|nr:FtsQ-type POTRA domain-containing protein [Feifaniaceae bacterium]
WAIAGVSVTAVLLLSYFLFLLRTVEVDGNGTYADESILELSGLNKGTHMLLCSGDEVRTNIEKNPYLEVTSVTKELPGTIRIAVAERVETAAIRSQDYDVIIDDTGHVLSIGKGSDLSDLLLVSGMSNIGFEVNEQIGKASDLQTQALLSLIRELKNLDLLKDVSRADLANPLNVCLYTTENITVVLGQPDGLSEKLTWMRDALPSLRKSGVAGGTLDVSARGGAIYAPAQGALDTENAADPETEQDIPPDAGTPPDDDTPPDGETPPDEGTPEEPPEHSPNGE